MAAIARPMARRRKPLFPDDPAPQRDIAYDYRRAVGAWLQGKRLEQGLTQAEVGDVLGVIHTAVSAIESGRSAVPPERYMVLADLMAVPHKEFGLRMLRYTNPWCYSLIFGVNADLTLADDLAALPERVVKRAANKPVKKSETPGVA